MSYERISDDMRVKIPVEFRCPINYNGYHNWEVLYTKDKEQKAYVLCTKCLEKRDIDKIKIKE